MNEHAEALSHIIDPGRHFYNCRCGWSGDELLYKGITYHPLDTDFAAGDQHGQGVCPECYTPFKGCMCEMPPKK